MMAWQIKIVLFVFSQCMKIVQFSLSSKIRSVCWISSTGSRRNRAQSIEPWRGDRHFISGSGHPDGIARPLPRIEWDQRWIGSGDGSGNDSDAGDRDQSSDDDAVHSRMREFDEPKTTFGVADQIPTTSGFENAFKTNYVDDGTLNNKGWQVGEKRPRQIEPVWAEDAMQNDFMAPMKSSPGRSSQRKIQCGQKFRTVQLTSNCIPTNIELNNGCSDTTIKQLGPFGTIRRPSYFISECPSSIS